MLVDSAKFSRVEWLLLESLHRSGSVELNDRTIPAIAAWLGCTSQLLATAKNDLLHRGLISQEVGEISGSVIIRLTTTGEIICREHAGQSETDRAPWWQFWKR